MFGWFLSLLAAVAFGSYMIGVVVVFRKLQADSWQLRVLKLCALIAAILNVVLLFRIDPFERSGPSVGLTHLIPSSLALLCAIVGATLLAACTAAFWLLARMHASSAPLSLAFSNDVPQRLVQEGPYRYVRHPFYSVYVLSYCAGFIASGHVALLLVAVVMFAVYWFAARFEEEKFRGSELASRYETYRARTGMFLPRLMIHRPKTRS